MKNQPEADSSFPLRDLAIFVIVFFGLWTLAVVVIWQRDGVSEPLRPWVRTAFWIGAVLIWISWQQLSRPADWLGLVPVSTWTVASCLAVSFAVFAWNEFRTHTLMAPTLQLSAWTFDHFGWSFTGALAEELVFRGVILTQARRSFSAHWAVVGTAALFVAVHVPGWVLLSIPVDGIEVATVFLVGIISGWLRWATGSIWPAVAVHWTNNLGAAL